jgi:pyridoxal biosynthesis lyase PdxS
VLAAVPDRRRRPSDGIVVEASILARVLGARLLTLDATVVVAPADVTARSSAPRDSQALTPARSVGVPPARGRGLAEAVRSIDEGAAILAETRRTGTASPVGGDAAARR